VLKSGRANSFRCLCVQTAVEKLSIKSHNDLVVIKNLRWEPMLECYTCRLLLMTGNKDRMQNMDTDRKTQIAYFQMGYRISSVTVFLLTTFHFCTIFLYTFSEPAKFMGQGHVSPLPPL